MKKVILGIVALAICVALSAASPKKVHVLYWNIQNGMWSDQPNNYDNFVKFVKDKNPDICVWCEGKTLFANHTSKKIESTGKYLPGNWDMLAERYGHSYVYVGMEKDGYPQVITSKFPVKNIKRIAGVYPDSVVAHGAGWAEIQIGAIKLNVVTVHTYPQAYGHGIKDKELQKESAKRFEGEAYRRTEMEYICKTTVNTVKNVEKQYFMMLGDFNSISRKDNFLYNYADDDPRFQTQDYILENTPYIDAVAAKHPGEFFQTSWSKRRIDFVYMTPALYGKLKDINVIEAWAERTSAGVSNFRHPSDHRPIEFWINF